MYRNDSTVAFLFIDTRDTDKDRETLIKDFIEQNKYGFTVLYDVNKKSREDHAMVRHYKVDGIPTKFVIDPNGSIRFKAVGFGGDDYALVEELSAMIDPARDGSR